MKWTRPQPETLRIILPPLLVALFIFFPVDFTSALFWIFAGIAAAISVFTFLLNTGRLLSHTTIRPKKRVLIRPLLTILFFGLAVWSNITTKESAQAEALAEAKLILKHFKNGYPATVTGFNGWKNSTYEHWGSKKDVGYPATRPLSYKLIEEGQSFELYLYVDFDNVYQYRPVNGEIEVLHNCC